MVPSRYIKVFFNWQNIFQCGGDVRLQSGCVASLARDLCGLDSILSVLYPRVLIDDFKFISKKKNLSQQNQDFFVENRFLEVAILRKK